MWQVTLDVAFHPLFLPVEYKYVVCSAGGGVAGEFEAVKWETDICNRIAFLPLARAQVMNLLLFLLFFLLLLLLLLLLLCGTNTSQLVDGYFNCLPTQSNMPRVMLQQR